MACGLVRKHQFGGGQVQYEKSYHRNDHIPSTDSGEVKEFCDPRIQQIKQTIEEIFDVDIPSISYFYGTKKKNKS